MRVYMQYTARIHVENICQELRAHDWVKSQVCALNDMIAGKTGIEALVWVQARVRVWCVSEDVPRRASCTKIVGWTEHCNLADHIKQVVAS